MDQQRTLDVSYALIAFLMAVWLSSMACDGGTEPNPEPALHLAISPSAIEVEQGGISTINVTLTRIDFAGPVTVTLEGAGPVRVSAEPLVLGTGTDESVVTGSLVLAAAEVATPGAFEGEVVASATGVDAVGTALDITVVGVPTGDFSIGLEPATLSLAEGTSTTASVTIARTDGFEGEVELSVGGLPAGVDASFDPAITVGTGSTLTVAVSDEAEPGEASLLVIGTASELGDREAELGLEIVARPVAEVLSFVLCEEVGLADWLAVQDGDGDWRRVVPDRQTAIRQEFSFEITEGRFGIAWYGESSPVNPRLTVVFAPRVEGDGPIGEVKCFADEAPLRSVSGTVASWWTGGGPLPLLSLGDHLPAYHIHGDTALRLPFTIDRVRPGVKDLLAARVRLMDEGSASIIDRMVIRRGLDVPDGGTLDPIDFAGHEAFTPEDAQVTLENVMGEPTSVSYAFVTRHAALTVPYSRWMPPRPGHFRACHRTGRRPGTITG